MEKISLLLPKKEEIYRSKESGNIFIVDDVSNGICIMINIISKLKINWSLTKFHEHFTRHHLYLQQLNPAESKFLKKIKEIKKEEFGIIEERNRIYGNSFEKVGQILAILFPDGIQINSEVDHIKFDLLKNLVGKITRFSNNFPSEFHKDSIIDIANYATILLSVSNNINNKK